MKLSITHIALHVEDLDTCIEFYQEFCELEIVHKRESAAWLTNEELKNKFVIVLIKGGKRGKQKFKKDFSHIGIAVDSLEDLFRKVKEGKKLGCYAFGPFKEDYPTGHIAGFLDPNGNLVELSYDQPIGL
jgi:catechol 2,3-dioxygenase-like lactoylglutathione lyase family enzyme